MATILENSSEKIGWQRASEFFDAHADRGKTAAVIAALDNNKNAQINLATFINLVAGIPDEEQAKLVHLVKDHFFENVDVTTEESLTLNFNQLEERLVQAQSAIKSTGDFQAAESFTNFAYRLFVASYYAEQAGYVSPALSKFVTLNEEKKTAKKTDMLACYFGMSALVAMGIVGIYTILGVANHSIIINENALTQNETSQLRGILKQSLFHSALEELTLQVNLEYKINFSPKNYDDLSKSWEASRVPLNRVAKQLTMDLDKRGFRLEVDYSSQRKNHFYATPALTKPSEVFVLDITEEFAEPTAQQMVNKLIAERKITSNSTAAEINATITREVNRNFDRLLADYTSDNFSAAAPSAKIDYSKGAPSPQ